MKLFGDRIWKSSMKNWLFVIFVCRDADWIKVVQLAEQHEAVEGKSYNILGRKGSGILVQTFLLYHMIRFYIMKSSISCDPEDSILSSFSFMLYIGPKGN